MLSYNGGNAYFNKVAAIIVTGKVIAAAIDA
jgi:hypothetical protein